MIVVDASVVLELLLRTRVAARIEERVLQPGCSLHAPHLLDVEVVQVLRRYAGRGVLSDGRAREALLDLRDLPLTRYPHEPFLDRIWDLRENLTAYDALYLALAETLGAPLVTRDQRLASAPGVGETIELV